MEDYVRQRHIEEGFDFVSTPHITKDGLFHTSGHLPYYADSMFPPMELEGAEYRLKAMNCPMHNLIYRSRGRSYRELPLRLFEFGSVYRYEKSGVVHGLTRVRGLTQDDSHTYCTPEQAPDEIKHLLDFVPRPAARLRPRRLLPRAVHPRRRQPGQVHRLGRGVGDRHRGAAPRWPSTSGLELVPDPGGAAYYGPKISVQARDAIGRTWQMSTIQYDFNQPARLRAGVPGRRRHPAAAGDDPLGQVRLDRAVHRRAHRALRRRVPGLAVAGAGHRHPGHRRAGRLPGRGRRASCKSRGIRVEVDDSDDRMQKKIRTAQQQKVPFMLIAGADRRRGRRGVASATATARSATASRSTQAVDEIADTVPAGSTPRRPRTVRVTRLTDAASRAGGDFAGEADGFGRLWTPHRMAYIKGENKPADGDDGPTARSARRPARTDEDGLIVARGRARLRRAQPVPVQLRAPDGGAVPARRRLPRARPTPRRLELAQFTQRAMRVHPRGDGAARVQPRHQPGRVAGAGIAAHLHQHVVPRWGGDTNFMPIVGHTRVLPQLLADAREPLAASWSDD